MRTALALIFLTISAFAQDIDITVAASESACGPLQAQFKIKTNAMDKHIISQPEPGKALVYVIEDQKFRAVDDVTARVGLDGAWVGANRGPSYLSFSVDPGEHHLCTDWLSDFLPNGRLVSLANFTAEPGKVYYFRARTSGGRASMINGADDAGDSASIDLDEVNSDEGKLLVASSSLSVSQAKK